MASYTERATDIKEEASQLNQKIPFYLRNKSEVKAGLELQVKVFSLLDEMSERIESMEMDAREIAERECE